MYGFTNDANERPLEKLLTDGGFTGIFRTIGCIGDSLSSGEFEGTDANGNKTYHDMFDYSWGQYMARMAGSKVYNFSRGGITAREYLETFADDNGFWNRAIACQAYVMALGVNDISQTLRGEAEFGDESDICLKNWRENKHTFTGCYAALIQRYREIAPDSVFFLMTIPRDGETNERTPYDDKHAQLLYRLAEMFPNTYVLDFRKFAPVYDKDFMRVYWLGGHMNPMGYMLTAKMVVSYIDYIIRHDMRAFSQVGFINTEWKNTVDVD